MAPIVVDLISLMAELPKDLLLAAQRNDKSTSRLVNALETSLEFASALNSRLVSILLIVFMSYEFIIENQNYS